MSTHPTPAGTHDHDEKPAGTSKNFMLLAAAAVFAFLIFLGVFVFRSSSSDGGNKQKQKDIAQTAGTATSNYSYTKTVPFTTEYSDVTNIPSGFMVSILEASEPYCMTNGNDSEFGCSEGTEDILSNDNFTSENPNNRSMRFKSQNGKNGFVTLLLRSKQ